MKINPEVDFDRIKRLEWILTNGIGGFAMGTVAGLNTRRYHGMLIAALDPPTNRKHVLAGVEVFAKVGTQSFPLCSNQYVGAVYPDGVSSITEFQYDEHSVSWTYSQKVGKFKKRICLTPGQNEVVIELTNCTKRVAKFSIRPLLGIRGFHENFREQAGFPQAIESEPDSITVIHDGVSLLCDHPDWERSIVEGWYYRFEHPVESERGLDPIDDLYCAYELIRDVPAGGTCEVRFRTVGAGEGIRSAIRGASSILDQLKTSAEQFLVKADRTTILAGYPWFSDWGRDTMISLPGICLATERIADARALLLDYGRAVHHGLIPNRFSESGSGADYNTADATLWFANAIYKTLRAEWDADFASQMYRVLREIHKCHLAQTDFGIGVDADDGLLRQGLAGTQLTWMDAKIGDWVVTPRHGKPIEINALWINLLRIMVWIGTKLGEEVESIEVQAFRAETSFNSKFWHKVRGHYLDTVEPHDASLRPNQVIAMALPFTPCHVAQASKSLYVVNAELVTPYGLRTLGPKEPGYRGRFEGPVNELDAAYHQGTVWPWLLGSYITACAKFAPELLNIDEIQQNIAEMLSHRGLGGISEVYDGDAPHRPNGCPWQAWSVAELLRALAEFSSRATPV